MQKKYLHQKQTNKKEKRKYLHQKHKKKEKTKYVRHIVGTASQEIGFGKAKRNLQPGHSDSDKQNADREHYEVMHRAHRGPRQAHDASEH